METLFDWHIRNSNWIPNEPRQCVKSIGTLEGPCNRITKIVLHSPLTVPNELFKQKRQRNVELL